MKKLKTSRVGRTYTICPAQPSDAPQLASLVMRAMGKECCQWFVGKGKKVSDFKKALISLMEQPATQYSYQNTLCAYVNNQLAGVLIAYDGAKLHSLRAPFIQLAQERWQRDLSDIADETSAGELYVDTLAVKWKFRRQGIATSLLRAAAERATRLGIERIGLLVDDSNLQAQKFYDKVGLKQVGVNMWGGHAMRHLQLDLSAGVDNVFPYTTVIIDTPFGPLRLCGDAHALVKCQWADTLSPAERLVSTDDAQAEELQSMILAKKQLTNYLKGRRRTLRLPLRLQGTPFQQKVWQALRQIPFGQTISYSELAAQLGCPSASRAVAQAARSNPLNLLVPCHRLVGVRSLGGYCGSVPAGLRLKEQLLSLEGARL
ncbi:MAG: GNAT family N-acetyltransferase [Alloprevotella sp.]|nr:GNAT family N-acetyltransferase [Alloprevotella sp.]